MKPHRLQKRVVPLVYVLAALLCLGMLVRKGLYQNLNGASQTGDAQRVRLLLHLGLSPNGSGNKASLPLNDAIYHNQTTTAIILLRAGAQFDHDALCETLHRKNTALVRELIKRGADVNTLCWGSSPLMAAIETGDDRLVELLVNQGADVRYVQTEAGNIPVDTPLARAITYRDAVLVALFLARGADPNIRYNLAMRTSPLINAAQSGYAEMVRLLLQYHADVNARTRMGETALSWAERGLKGAQTTDQRRAFAEVVRLLKSAGARETPADQIIGPTPTNPRLFARWSEQAKRIERANDWPSTPVSARPTPSYRR